MHVLADSVPYPRHPRLSVAIQKLQSFFVHPRLYRRYKHQGWPKLVLDEIRGVSLAIDLQQNH
jgi:hypothetical protein